MMRKTVNSGALASGTSTALANEDVLQCILRHVNNTNGVACFSMTSRHNSIAVRKFLASDGSVDAVQQLLIGNLTSALQSEAEPQNASSHSVTDAQQSRSCLSAVSWVLARAGTKTAVAAARNGSVALAACKAARGPSSQLLPPALKLLLSDGASLQYEEIMAAAKAGAAGLQLCLQLSREAAIPISISNGTLQCYGLSNTISGRKLLARAVATITGNQLDDPMTLDAQLDNLGFPSINPVMAADLLVLAMNSSHTSRNAKIIVNELLGSRQLQNLDQLALTEVLSSAVLNSKPGGGNGDVLHSLCRTLGAYQPSPQGLKCVARVTRAMHAVPSLDTAAAQQLLTCIRPVLVDTAAADSADNQQKRRLVFDLLTHSIKQAWNDSISRELFRLAKDAGVNLGVLEVAELLHALIHCDIHEESRAQCIERKLYAARTVHRLMHIFFRIPTAKSLDDDVFLGLLRHSAAKCTHMLFTTLALYVCDALKRRQVSQVVAKEILSMARSTAHTDADQVVVSRLKSHLCESPPT